MTRLCAACPDRTTAAAGTDKSPEWRSVASDLGSLRGLAHAAADDLGNLVVISGPNGAGKSSPCLICCACSGTLVAEPGTDVMFLGPHRTRSRRVPRAGLRRLLSAVRLRHAGAVEGRHEPGSRPAVGRPKRLALTPATLRRSPCSECLSSAGRRTWSIFSRSFVAVGACRPSAAPPCAGFTRRLTRARTAQGAARPRPPRRTLIARNWRDGTAAGNVEPDAPRGTHVAIARPASRSAPLSGHSAQQWW
jgi:hypothetical protein